MIKKTDLKKTVGIILVLLFLVSSCSGVISLDNVNFFPSFNKDLSKNHSSNQLSIVNISGGFGIDFSLVNEGSKLIKNITIEAKVMGSGLMFPRDQKKELVMLSPKESANIHLHLFGVGMGDLIKTMDPGRLSDFPLISITASTSQSELVQKTIALKIIGPVTIIGGEYFNEHGSYEGYTLFAPEYSKYTYLISNNGEIVHTWKSKYIQGLGAYLLENGDLIRSSLYASASTGFSSGGITGRVEVLSWDNTKRWDFTYATDEHHLHHDIEVLPNGNILMAAWEYKTAAEAIDAGRKPDTLKRHCLWPDHIIEVNPDKPDKKNIVWEWHVWDHLIQEYDSSKQNYGVVADHPELVDINYMRRDGIPDWNHINSIDYNEEFDQILLSVCNFGEIWVIDHSTSTEEAAGHTGGRYGKGGDLLYRWGNPQVYQAGNASDQQLFGQHDAQWIEHDCPGAGNILIFNNGAERPGGSYATVDEIKPPVYKNGTYSLNPGHPYGPEACIWTYSEENPLYAGYTNRLSGAQRLPNGNTLICYGPLGHFFEVKLNCEKVWQYDNIFPDFFENDVFKIRRYPLNFSGIKIP